MFTWVPTTNGIEQKHDGTSVVRANARAHDFRQNGNKPWFIGTSCCAPGCG